MSAEFLPEGMAGGVGVDQGVVAAVGVAVEGLGIRRGLDDGVGLGEAAEFGVVVTGAVVVEARRGVEALAGVVERDCLGSASQ